MNKLIYFLNEILAFLTNKRFIIHLLGIATFLVFVLIATFTWLRIYTNHGQKLELTDYTDQEVSSAVSNASDQSFEIIVNDSVHIVGKEGGLIIHQNPPGGSLVKEKRKIYVTVTKYKADKIDLSDMMFFGQEYDQIAASLKRKSISSEIKEYKYDALTQNSVLEVWYEGNEIISRNKNPNEFVVDKGATLDFVVSSFQGGSVITPDILNAELGSAIFRLTPLRLNIEVTNSRDYEGRDINQAIIVEQYPSAGTELSTNSIIQVKVAFNQE